MHTSCKIGLGRFAFLVSKNGPKLYCYKNLNVYIIVHNALNVKRKIPTKQASNLDNVFIFYVRARILCTQKFPAQLLHNSGP